MKRHAWGRSVAALATGVMVVGSGSTAWASGFQLIEQNGTNLGNAYAGQAALGEDASTVFTNPAGMTRLKGTHLSLGGAVIQLGTSFTDTGSIGPATYLRGLPVPPQIPLGGDGGEAGSTTPVPSFYLSHGFNERVFAGIGVSVPFGLKTDWDATWVGRFHAVTSDVKTININPSLAYKVN